MVGAGAYGTRVVASATGGWARGERINGSLVGACADCLLVGPDGYGRADVRLQIETGESAPRLES